MTVTMYIPESNDLSCGNLGKSAKSIAPRTWQGQGELGAIIPKYIKYALIASQVASRDPDQCGS